MCLENETLPVLKKSGNTNYEFKQTMGEIDEAIGLTLEEILREVRDSPSYSVTLDEATDISVTKQLGICIQYLDSNAIVRVRILKLLEITQGTAALLTDALMSYLTSTAPVTLNISKLAGGATNGASVMVGRESGVVTKIRHSAYVHRHTLQSHRLSLASCDASNASSMVQRFQQILSQIYVFFSRSSVCTAELSATLEVTTAYRDKVALTSKFSGCT